MRSAAYLGLGLLLAFGVPVLAAPPGAQPPAAKADEAAAQPKPAPGQVQPQPGPAQASPAQASAAQARAGAARERRRAHSYASCNRGAYQRGLRGGARRRFLIRCRLGYDRPRVQPPQQQSREPAGGAQPMRKP